MDLSPLLSPAISGTPHAASGASAPMPPSKKMSNLFDQIDPSASGAINQNQFQQAFQSMNPAPSFQAAGVDAVWSQLDPNGTGSVSKQDFVSNMAAMIKQFNGGGPALSSSSGAQELAQNTGALDALGSNRPTLNAFA